MAGGVAAQEAGGPLSDWDNVRDLFALSPDTIHMSAMLLSSHPAPVRDASARHREALDADPVAYLERRANDLTAASREAAKETKMMDGWATRLILRSCSSRSRR